jgi:hypothetical protein
MSEIEAPQSRPRCRGMTEAQRCSGELVVFSLDLDVKQSFVICAVSPGLLQELDVAIFKLAADGLFKLSPAYLFVGLLLLGSLVNRLEAGLHTQSDGTSWVAEKSLSRVVRMLKRRESDGSRVNCSSGEMASRVAERMPNLSLLRYL